MGLISLIPYIRSRSKSYSRFLAKSIPSIFSHISQFNPPERVKKKDYETTSLSFFLNTFKTLYWLHPLFFLIPSLNSYVHLPSDVGLCLVHSFPLVWGSFFFFFFFSLLSCTREFGATRTVKKRREHPIGQRSLGSSQNSKFQIRRLKATVEAT
ncbi:hypothetical protein F5Y11DRAFT_120691 [Daldinia sp. FL1419]|nr:hypothetical protein F5Y11DRAFT_120691 [Daldinia sp. FL1419]